MAKEKLVLEDEFSKKAKDTLGEVIGDWLIRFAGSWLFLGLNIVFFIVWLGMGKNYDWLTLWVSLEAIVLTVLILIVTVRVEDTDRSRSIKDYKIDVTVAKRLKRVEEKIDRLLGEKKKG